MFIKPASERTCKAVAVREGLSHSTVKEIFNRLAALKKSSTVVDTRVLGKASQLEIPPCLAL
jgi:hypothetical protein